jgi:hypothetical protein
LGRENVLKRRRDRRKKPTGGYQTGLNKHAQPDLVDEIPTPPEQGYRAWVSPNIVHLILSFRYSFLKEEEGGFANGVLN